MRCCKYLSVGAILFLLTSSVYAISLKDAIGEALETNPVVKERRKNFNETQQDLEIAKSEWLPSVDLQSSIGRVNSGKFKDKNKNYSHFVDSTAYNHYTNSLKLTQNLFRGFSTTQKINYQQTRILAAANHYIESANDIAFQMVGAYIDVIRSYRLLQNAKDNVEINKKIFEDVDALYQQGLTTKSEMTKIYASLSLANSNLIVWQNNTIDKEARFKRLLGRSVNVASLTLPNLNFAMPESKERAAQIAIQNNPSILVSKYNIQGAQALYREKKSKFYPTIDLEAEQVFNDYSKGQTLDSPDDRQRVYLVLNWNLYSGGAHKADLQKSRSTIYKETEIQRDLKRQILEGLELSWNAYDLLGNQLEELYKYYEFSLETLENYKDEYDMGRRTLLDLLTAQNDLINSKSQIINAQLDKLFAQYRILDAMGLLVQSTVDSAQYNKIIHPTLNPFDITKDELPVNKDIDGDGIVDSLDICDNSILGNDDITPYGCSQKEKDSDFDGVPDSLDKCPDTPFGAILNEQGCEIDSKQNRYLIQDETYIKPVAKHDVQSPKKESTKGLYDYEFNAVASKNVESTKLDKHLYYDDFTMIKRFEFVNMDQKKIDLNEIANELKKHNETDAIVTIIGHSEGMEDKTASYDKALGFANSVKNKLVDLNVDEKILMTQTRADLDKYYLETRKKDKSLNNVVAISLYVPKANEAKVATKQEPKAKKSSASWDDLDDDSDGVMNKLDKCPDTPAGYSVDEHGCTKAINLEVNFENNSSVVVASSTDKVLAFAKFMNDNDDFNTLIVGHASDDGTASKSYNQWLSEKRAYAIRDILVENGVSSSRIAAEGKGHTEPVAKNSTLEGQAQNRRIEAVLIRK